MVSAPLARKQQLHDAFFTDCDTDYDAHTPPRQFLPGHPVLMDKEVQPMTMMRTAQRRSKS